MTVERFAVPEVPKKSAVRLLAPHFQICLAADGESASWRLLSGNNRNLGRSGGVYEGVQDCRRAIVTMVDAVDLLQGVVRPAGEHRWVWMLRDGTDIVAISGHRYDRQVRCEAARQQFIGYARAALIDPDVMRIRPRRSVRI